MTRAARQCLALPFMQRQAGNALLARCAGQLFLRLPVACCASSCAAIAFATTWRRNTLCAPGCSGNSSLAMRSMSAAMLGSTLKFVLIIHLPATVHLELIVRLFAHSVKHNRP
jgi:hypothetical protein